jgi:hypothetical protein
LFFKFADLDEISGKVSGPTMKFTLKSMSCLVIASLIVLEETYDSQIWVPTKLVQYCQIKLRGWVGLEGGGAWELGLKNVCRCSVDINIKNYKEFSDITKSI